MADVAAIIEKGGCSKVFTSTDDDMNDDDNEGHHEVSCAVTDRWSLMCVFVNQLGVLRSRGLLR